MSIRTTLMSAAVALLVSAPAFAQDAHQHHMAGGDAMSNDVVIKAYEAANMKMHKDMAIKLTGDADADFVRGMIAHHQGAIDMANTEIKDGKFAPAVELARAIVKAQQQEMYFEDLGGVVVQAIELVRSGEVRAEAPRPAPAPAPQPAPAPTPAPARPAPQPGAASRPDPQPAPAPAPQPAPRPTYRTVPMDQVAGEKVRATCACPGCGAALTVTVPNANCLVNITCTECGRTFPMEVRRRS